MTQVLPIQHMDSEAFRPFGELVPLDGSAQSFEINGGRAIRHFDIATVDVDAKLDRAFVSVFAAQPHPDAFEIEMLERHPLGSQAFIPLCPADWVVIVAPESSGGGPGDPIAFRPEAGYGVNIVRGVWHYPLISRCRASFLVVDGGIEEENLEICRFDAPRWRIATLG